MGAGWGDFLVCVCLIVSYRVYMCVFGGRDEKCYLCVCGDYITLYNSLDSLKSARICVCLVMGAETRKKSNKTK